MKIQPDNYIPVKQFSKNQKTTLVYLLISVFFFLAVYDFYQGYILIGNLPSLESKRFVVFIIAMLFPLALWGYGLYLAMRGILPDKLRILVGSILDRTPTFIRIVVMVVLILLPTVLFLFTSFGNYFFIYWLRLFVLFSCGIFAALLISYKNIEFTWLLIASGMVLVTTAVFVIGTRLAMVSNYPFTLSWSEGNRFWDYSIMFGASRYINPSGKPIVPFLEAGRQFLWALPFMFPSIGILGMRVWNAILWIIPAFLLGLAAVFEAKTFRKEWMWQIGFALWCLLFLSQGPIYPPVVVCALLTVIGLRQRNFLVTVILIVIATYFARISRWTWMYAPGLWAGMLSLIEIHKPSFKSGRWKELIKPVIYGLSGLAGAEIFQRIIQSFFSGAVVEQGSVGKVLSNALDFHQPMLWDRLFPNPTYAPGIVLGFLWVGGPIIILLVWLVIKQYWDPNWMQRSAVLAILGAFSVLGMIISVKIGGGSNLHNLDLFWVSIVLLSGWVFRKLLDQGQGKLQVNRSVLAVLCLAMVMSATTLIQTGKPLIIPQDFFVETSLQKINEEIAKAKTSGEILFLDQRQLLTFGYVKDVPLVTSYEKKVLMEQSMSGNQQYFDGFYEDLKNHRFSLIISEPLQKVIVTESERNFGEENNVWVYWVSRPLLKYYKPLVTHDEVGVQLLVPREN